MAETTLLCTPVLDTVSFFKPWQPFRGHARIYHAAPGESVVFNRGLLWTLDTPASSDGKYLGCDRTRELMDEMEISGLSPHPDDDRYGFADGFMGYLWRSGRSKLIDL